jgi:hypothetical protein
MELLEVVNHSMDQSLVSSSNDGGRSRGGLLKMVGHPSELVDKDWCWCRLVVLAFAFSRFQWIKQSTW